MGRTLYLECSSGISGDMTVAALLDAGASQEKLERVLAGVPLTGFSTRVSRVSKSGLDACDFDVILDEAHENHDHDMAWLFGHETGGVEAGGKKKRGKKAKKRGKASEVVACATPVAVAYRPAEAAAPERRSLTELLEQHAEEIAAASDGAPGSPTDAPADACAGTPVATGVAPVPTVAADAAEGSADAACPQPHVNAGVALAAEPEHTHAGAEHAASGTQPHACEPTHAHEHEHAHEHRTLADVTAILDATPMSAGARAIAGRIFSQLAQAEAAAHGVPISQVHFHEVGAVDSIVDVVAVAVCLDDLDVTDVIVPELCEGRGTIRCAHGILPVPVPAVAAIARTARLPLRVTNVRGELVTPTGAAIVAAVRTSGELPGRFVVDAVGVGAGKRAYEGCSGVLRAMLITSLDAEAPAPAPTEAIYTSTFNPRPAAAGDDSVCKLECDVDDCTGEALAHAIDELMASGAREAHAVPLVMKKGRPGYQLQVLCSPADTPRMERVLFECTTTIGVRRTLMERTVLPREVACLQTPFGTALGKHVTLPGGQVRTYPEYESVAALSHRSGVPFQDAYRAVVAAAAQTDAQAAEHAEEEADESRLTLVIDGDMRPMFRVVPSPEDDDHDGDDPR